MSYSFAVQLQYSYHGTVLFGHIGQIRRTPHWACLGRVQRGSTGIKILFFTVRALDPYILPPTLLHIPLKTKYDAMAQKRLV